MFLSFLMFETFTDYLQKGLPVMKYVQKETERRYPPSIDLINEHGTGERSIEETTC